MHENSSFYTSDSLPSPAGGGGERVAVWGLAAGWGEIMTRAWVQPSQLLVGCERSFTLARRPLLNPVPETFPGIPALDKKCKTTGNSLHLQTAVYKSDNPQKPQRNIRLLHTKAVDPLHNQDVPTYYPPPPIKATKGCPNYMKRFVWYHQGNPVCPESLPTDFPSQSPNLDNEISQGQDRLSFLQAKAPVPSSSQESQEPHAGRCSSILLRSPIWRMMGTLVTLIFSEELQPPESKQANKQNNTQTNPSPSEKRKDWQLPWNILMKITAQCWLAVE